MSLLISGKVSHHKMVAQRQNIIEAHDLRKEFGPLAAVDGISFRVKAGECFGILGPNGAGKTSTIRMVYGFSPMTSGSLRVFGYDISKDASIVKSRVGVCQQENSLDPDLTVQENLEVFASYFDIPKGEARQKALELLKFNALNHRAHSKVSELSGGLMRRLVLARALINAPDLLILDLLMPRMDGWGVIREMRSEPRYADVPILVLTTVIEDASRRRYELETGMTMDVQDYVQKPARPDDLIKRIEKMLVLKR